MFIVVECVYTQRKCDTWYLLNMLVYNIVDITMPVIIKAVAGLLGRKLDASPL